MDSGRSTPGADGSAGFLEDSANQATAWALGSINRGEVVSADSY